MTAFLFWNLNKQDLHPTVAEAVHERDVDIVMLAECGATDDDVVQSLSQRSGRTFVALSAGPDKVRVFTSMDPTRWTLRQSDPETTRMVVWSLDVGPPPGVVLAAVHLVSKNNFTEIDQALLTTAFSKELQEVERVVGHERSIVVGDFNMNPFEAGVVSASCLHAVMSRTLLRKSSRTVQGATHPFLYNPMWGLFGDRTHGPPGTHYYHASRPGELFWHMLDQVLLRPDLMDSLADLVIVDRIGSDQLTHEGTGIPKNEYSDHLPLYFRLDLA